MPTDDQIRELCGRALTTHGSEFEAAIRDLQSALRARMEGLSNLTLATLLKIPGVRSRDEEPGDQASLIADNKDEKAG